MAWSCNKALFQAALTVAGVTAGAGETTTLVDPESTCGLDFYSQGGVVQDGIAYFTANDYSRREGVKRTEACPCVVAFDLRTFRTIRRYPFAFTYDSSPFLFPRRDGTVLIAAHEYKLRRTTAMERDTGKLAWRSAANQPGAYFFGYSFYLRQDGLVLVLGAFQNGLHAMSADIGEDVWCVQRPSTGGITPCVDQERGIVYYQCNGKVLKIAGETGEVLKEVEVGPPITCISWNTVLVDDEHGRYVGTRWFGKPEWDSAIRVHDAELNLVWEKTGLPNGKKDTLTYVDGRLICGSGNGWSKNYKGSDWKVIVAYSIKDGREVWRCDLSAYDYIAVSNLPCTNGSLYAESSGKGELTSKLFRINAATGKLEEAYDYGRPITSCATQIVARGMVLSGDLWQDSIVATRIAKGSVADWPGPFGDPQRNDMRVVGAGEGTQRVPVREISPPERRIRSTAAAVAVSKGAPMPEPDPRPKGENLVPSAAIKPSRQLTGAPYSLAHTTDGLATVNRPIRQCESCWAGDGTNLHTAPLDVVVDFGAPQTIDRVIVTTCRLKNQQRLTDFDIFGWAGTDWDGHTLLARVRGSDSLRMDCGFDAVETSKICIRLLDNARPNHDFPHISELEVYAAAGPAKRQLRPGGLPRALSELKTLADLRAEGERLQTGGELTEGTKRRLDFIKRKIGFREDEQRWRGRLAAIEEGTRALLAEGVPPWAAAQCEALAKYTAWIHWWIERQQPDGQFGGTWNDDVELVCGWPVACMAAGDVKTSGALRLLADGVWDWGPVGKYGYSTYTDVEHSAEEISYSQPRMVLLEPGEPKWAERCRVTVGSCRKHFMAENSRGFLQFKSDWFGFKGDKPTIDPKRSFDIPQSSKALKPGLYPAWNGDEAMKEVVLRYGDTWLDAAMKESKEKPRGLLPSRLSFPSGEPQGVCTWMPVMRATHYHLLGCYLLSGERRYLEPIEATIKYMLVDNGLDGLPLVGVTRGREHLATLDSFATIASMWRIASGDTRFDAQFEAWSRRLAGAMSARCESYSLVERATPELWIKEPLTVGAFRMARRTCGTQLYVGWLAGGDKDLLVKACRNLANDVTDLWGPLTWWFYDKTERRVTSNDHSAHSLQPGAEMLMLMYTGGTGPIEAKYPYTPVVWHGTSTEFAALVLESSRRTLRLLACNLETSERTVEMALNELQPGAYGLTAGPDADGDNRPDEVGEAREVQIRKGTRVKITLPPRVVQAVRLVPRV